MRKKAEFLRTRIASVLLALICVLGLLPTSAFAAGDIIKLERFGKSDVSYQSAALGSCRLHQMYFGSGGDTTVGFCGSKGKKMNISFVGQSWNNKTPISDPTVEVMMAYYYAHSTGRFTDAAKAASVADIWDDGYTWYMNAWVQACIWRYKEGTLTDPVVACAEELMAVYNSLEGTNYTDIDQERDNASFRARAQYILDLGTEVWGNCAVYEYTYAGTMYAASDVQLVILGDLDIGETEDWYSLTVKKVDATNPTKGLPGATFHIEAVNNSYSRDVVTGADGTYTLERLTANTYAITETAPPPGGYGIDNAGPIYVVLPNNGSNTVTVTFSDTPEITGSGSIRKVDADNPTRGLAGAVIKIEGVDNNFSGTYTTSAGGYLTDVPWDTMPVGSYTATEVTPPEGYSLSSDPNKVKQSFYWDGHTDVSLVFENDAKVKVQLLKLDDSGNPLAGAVFNILKDGQIIGSEATSAAGTITVSNVTEGLYAFVEASAPAPFARLREPVLVYVDQATVDGGGTVSVTATDRKLPRLTIRKIEKGSDPVITIPNTVFLVEAIDSDYRDTWTTGPDGSVTKYVPEGSFKITEQSVPAPYYLPDEDSGRVQTISLRAGDEKTVVFEDLKGPQLTVVKENSITGDPVAGTRIHITYTSNGEAADAPDALDYGVFYTDENGEVRLHEQGQRLYPGVFTVTEEEASTGFQLNDPVTQVVTLHGGESRTISFKDSPLSAIVVWKFDSVNGGAVEGAVFQVRYLSETSGTGGAVIGTYKTGKNGAFTVTGCKAGSYLIEELASDASHVIDSAPQTAYISGAEQDIVQLYFGNAPKGSLLITKISDDEKRLPLSGVDFLVTDSGGAFIGDKNGVFTTDSTGSILIDNQEPGKVLIVKEVRAKSGYLLDDTPQIAAIQSGKTVALEFRNAPAGNLRIVKKSTDGTPLEGVEFLIRYADGSFLPDAEGKISSNGIYFSDSNGEILISGVVGTVIATETATLPGYTIHEESRSQTVAVDPGDTQTLYFYNDPIGGVEIIKVNEDNRNQRIPNTTFEIRRIDGGLVTTVTTDGAGRAFAALEDGDYYAVETVAGEGFRLDSTPHYFTIQDGKTTLLTVTNKAICGILIHKIDSNTGKGISGVTFLLYDSGMNPIGQYTSDQSGYVHMDDLPNSGRYYLRELENEGYIVDTGLKSVYVSAGKTSEITWKNTPITGQIQIIKKSADYNSANGLPAGTLLEGAVFEVYDKANKLVDTIHTNSRGLAASRQLPLGRYTVREVQAPANYGVNDTVLNAYLEYEGQIVTLEVTDKSLVTGVSITKTGPKEIMPGQPVRYVFSGIANTSNVRLDSFYWRDTLPSAVRLKKVVTGTYNFPGSYKVVLKTNLSGDYLTLADNLSTAKSYTLDASPVALGLAANEYVTEVMFAFGQAPGGFAQVERPMLYCTAVSGPGVTSFVNVADAGGSYGGKWIQAVSRWVTAVYGKPAALPKTGY